MSDADALRADLRDLASALVKLRVRLLHEREDGGGYDDYAIDALLDQTGAMTDLLAEALQTAWGPEAIETRVLLRALAPPLLPLPA